MKTKAAFAVFLPSFSIWLYVLISVCFPSGTWANPVRFPNSSLFALFFGAATIAAASGLILGLNYMGLDFKVRSVSRGISQSPSQSTTVSVPKMAKTISTTVTEVQDSTPQEKTMSIVMPPQPERGQVIARHPTRKKRQPQVLVLPPPEEEQVPVRHPGHKKNH